MKWIEILRNGNYALLQSETDTQYCVANGYNDKAKEDNQWDHGIYVMYHDHASKVEALSKALELFRSRTETNYITRFRLEELATKFKDGLYGAVFEDEEYDEFFNEECEMTDYEMNFFGIKDDKKEVENI